MVNENMQEQIDSINRKLDVILEEIELQKRHRREMEDLKDDLTRVGKDIFKSAVIELEEVHDHLETSDILYLGKKLLRNVKNIIKMIEQLENAMDFIEDFSPVFRDSIIDFMYKLDEYDRKGYFEFLKELAHITDNIVTSFSAQDVRRFGDDIVTILNTAKNLTPNMLNTVNNALSVYKNLDFKESEKVNITKLLREINKPEVKRGLLFAVRFLQNLANQEKINTNISKN